MVSQLQTQLSQQRKKMVKTGRKVKIYRISNKYKKSESESDWQEKIGIGIGCKIKNRSIPTLYISLVLLFVL